MMTEKLKDLFLFAQKSKIKAGEGKDIGRFPFYTSSPIQSKWIDKEHYSDESLIIGTGGKPSIHYENQPFSTSTDCLVITAKNKINFNVKYVHFYIITNIHILERGFKGAGLKHISKGFIEDIDIPLPNKETQDKIVAILDKVQDLIQKRKKSIEIYNELLKSLFFETFGDPGKNTKGWEVRKLLKNIEFIGDIGSNGSNVLISKNLDMKDDEDYALMVRTTNLRANDFSNKAKYISKEAYNFFEKSKIFGGEIIINKIGSSAGDFWIMPFLNKKVSLGLNQLVIRLKDLNTQYLFHYLSTEYGKMIVKSKVRGAAVQSITKTTIKNLPIIYPPIDLQNTFEKKVEKIELIKSKKQSSLKLIENLFFCLSQLAFKGKLDFNTAVDLEVLMENDYMFFRNNASNNSIKLLLERLDKDELNTNKFYEQDLYDKAKVFVFKLLNEKKIKQVFNKETKRIKLSVK